MTGTDTKDRADHIAIAKLAEVSERHDDMAAAMKQVIEMGDSLDVEERNLFSVAYKHVVGNKRTAWRVVASHKTRDVPTEINAMTKLKKEVEKELIDMCQQVVKLINDYLLPKDKTDSGKVFYLKMKGDYYRYMAEVETGDKRKEYSEEARKAYQEASEEAKKTLPTTHPIRLGLALNYSVYYYEIINDPVKARELADDELNAAVKEIEANTGQAPSNDTEMILQLLRDNLSLWNMDQETEQ